MKVKRWGEREAVNMTAPSPEMQPRGLTFKDTYWVGIQLDDEAVKDADFLIEQFGEEAFVDNLNSYLAYTANMLKTNPAFKRVYSESCKPLRESMKNADA
jgi:hypothetical protein